MSTGHASSVLDPWRLVWGRPYIDSQKLAAAIEQDLQRSPRPDFRTRLLVRDASNALRAYWGARRFGQWLKLSPAGEAIRAILKEELGKPGFSTIRSRLVDSIDLTMLRRILDLLGRAVPGRVEAHIAGSVPTLVKGLTARPTIDIDFVDEVPEEIRGQRDMLRRIRDQFGLKLAHVQSHFLPTEWRDRRHWLGDFGGLRVYLVDEYDIFVSKLSSAKEKHQSDVGVLALALDKETARRRLLDHGRAFLDDPKLRPIVLENWRFVFQEPLFPDDAPPQSSRPRRRGRRKPDGP